MSQENMMRDSLRKFSKGDSITDEELNGLVCFFKRTEEMLDELSIYFNPAYGFARQNARENLETLLGFERARKRSFFVEELTDEQVSAIE